MKIMKKLLTGALAAACVLGMAMSAAAAEVPSVIYDNNAVEKVTADNGGSYIWVDLQGEEIKRLPEQVVSAIQASNTSQTAQYVPTVKDFVKAANDPTITAAFPDAENWVWRSTFGDVQQVAGGSGTATEGPAILTFTVKGISEAKDVKFVHYDAKNGWEILEIVKIEGDKVSVKFNSLSPAAIAVVLKGAEPTVTPTPTPKPTGNASSGSKGNGNASPKTGVETDWMGFAAAAVILAVCGVVVSRKKRA